MKLSPEDDPDFDIKLSALRDWLAEPVLTDSYDFKENSDYTSRGNELMKKFSEIPSINSIQEDFIFFQRTIHGLFKVYERLEATVNLREAWGLPKINHVDS